MTPSEETPTRRRRDPEATRESILEAAESLFVESGFAAVPTSTIAARAGVTKSLIHHYFGSKEALWEEIKRRRFEAYFEAQRAMLVEREGSVELLRESVIAYFRSLQADPGLVRLTTWRTVEEDDPCLGQEAELFELGAQRIRESQDKGEIRADLDPVCVIKAFLGLSLHWFQTRGLLCQLLGSEAPPAGELDEIYLDTILRLFFEGVLTDEARASQLAAPSEQEPER